MGSVAMARGHLKDWWFNVENGKYKKKNFGLTKQSENPLSSLHGLSSVFSKCLLKQGSENYKILLVNQLHFPFRFFHHPIGLGETLSIDSLFRLFQLILSYAGC